MNIYSFINCLLFQIGFVQNGYPQHDFVAKNTDLIFGRFWMKLSTFIIVFNVCPIIKLFIWLGTGGNYSLGHFVFTNSFKFVVAPSTLPTFLHKLLPGAPFCCLRGPPVLSVLYSSFSHFSQPYFSRISM